MIISILISQYRTVNTKTFVRKDQYARDVGRSLGASEPEHDARGRGIQHQKRCDLGNGSQDLVYQFVEPENPITICGRNGDDKEYLQALIGCNCIDNGAALGHWRRVGCSPLLQ